MSLYQKLEESKHLNYPLLLNEDKENCSPNFITAKTYDEKSNQEMKQLLLDFEEVSIIEATPLKDNSVEEVKMSFRISEASPKIVNSGNKVNIRDFML